MTKAEAKAICEAHSAGRLAGLREAAKLVERLAAGFRDVEVHLMRSGKTEDLPSAVHAAEEIAAGIRDLAAAKGEP